MSYKRLIGMFLGLGASLFFFEQDQFWGFFGTLALGALGYYYDLFVTLLPIVSAPFFGAYFAPLAGDDYWLILFSAILLAAVNTFVIRQAVSLGYYQGIITGVISERQRLSVIIAQEKEKIRKSGNERL